MSIRRRVIAAAAGSMPPPQLQLLPISQQADQIPPPSSVAVIVQNLSKTGDVSTGIVDRDIFQQLLAEVLGPDGADPSDTAWFEDNIGVNYKVVEVVTDAGISILLQEDPFASTNDLLLQATNSLLVVRLTIQRSPQVLFCPPPAEHTAEANRPVLFLWLLPRLLPLLGHSVTDTLKQELLETIEALFIAAARTSDAWKYLTTAMRYCRSCVNCIIDSFQSTAKITAAMSRSYRLELPEEDFAINPSQLPKNSPPMLHQSLRFTIRDPGHAACVVIHLFSLISRLSVTGAEIPALRTTTDSLLWYLQITSRLWKSLDVWESLPMLHEKAWGIRLKILEALGNAMGQIPKSQYGGMKCESSCFLAIRSAAETLNRLGEKTNQPMEYTLASIFLEGLFVAESVTTVSEYLKEQAFPSAVKVMNSDETWGLLGHDLKVALLRLVLGITGESTASDKAKTFLQSITEGKWTFRDERLQEKADRLYTIEYWRPYEKIDNSNGPRKRLRLMMMPNKDDGLYVEAHPLVSEIYRLLGNQEADDLAGLSIVASDGFNNLDEAGRCTAAKYLGFLSCALAGGLIESPRTGQTKEWSSYKCSYCDADTTRLPSTVRSYADDGNKELFKTLEVFLKLDSFQRSAKVRVWGLMSLKRMLNHTRNLAHMSLREAPGAWCLNALTSSRREIRIAAGRTLPSFVGFDHDEALLRTNRVDIFGTLRSLSDDDLLLQETCVLAWSQIARVSSDEELNLALIRLVDYLGHANSFIIGVAYNEIQALAQIHDTTPRKLFQPFWRIMSVRVVKQLQSKPQIAQLLSELLQIEVSELLKTTQHYTLPYLILWKRVEIVERIAQACGANVAAVCHDNVPFILALLLAQGGDRVEQATMALLVNASTDFKNCSLTELVRPEGFSIAAELLKAAGEEDDADKKKAIHRALELVASLSRGRTIKRGGNGDYINSFFETNVLGIFAQFMESLKDVSNKLPTSDKIRTLKAIEEMVKVAGGSVGGALPQICACLQSALETESIRTSALYAWCTMMKTLPNEDVKPLLGQTFSVLLQYWDDFHDDAKNKAHELVTYLFKDFSKAIENDVGTIPSLGSISLLSKFEKQLNKWRSPMDIQKRFSLLARRCRHENVAVVEQALIELLRFIRDNQEFIHTAAINEQPDIIVPELIRTLLDVMVASKDTGSTAGPRVRVKIERLCAECLGLIGAVDPNRVEAPREKRDMMVLHNFERADESVEFVVFFLEERVVKAFLSATDPKVQAFLAFGMQELLKFIDVGPDVLVRTRSTQPSTGDERFASFSQVARETLTPFIKSKYVLQAGGLVPACSYPIFSVEQTHRSWLQLVLMDLLSKATGINAEPIFSVCSRIFKGQDISISLFLLPFVTLNVIIGGRDVDRENIAAEILAVLRPTGPRENPILTETLKKCSETVFLVIDHLTRWLRDKKKYNSSLKAQQARQQNRHVALDDEDGEDIAVQRVEAVLSVIPPDMMGLRSFDCNSYARALFYWEQHIRQAREHASEDEMRPLYERLQHIYTQIDEPDGIEGISTKLPVLNVDQQILEHRKAGRWTAAQSWYELLLSEKPDDLDTQINLLTCLKESGQHEMLLNQADSMMNSSNPHSRILEFAVEAAWISGKWDVLDSYLAKSNSQRVSSYEIRIGSALSALRKQDIETFVKVIANAREDVVNGLTESLTGSLRQCHDSMVRLHSLSELEEISLTLQREEFDKPAFSANLERRLDVMGTYLGHKQYILALRRAAFQLSGAGLVKDNIASTWLASARFARKAGQIHQSFHSVLHASRLGAPLATVEHAKLLWHEGQHRKAIQNLEGAIASNVIQTTPEGTVTESIITAVSGRNHPQNIVMAKAVLLLARWLDGAGQTHSKEIISKYTNASAYFIRWEQGHYFLGRHYNKLYEAEKGLSPTNQSQHFLTGEIAKLVCQCYLRALAFGAKYIFQTMPRLLTLWLDLGETVDKPLDETYGKQDFRNHIIKERNKTLVQMHVSIKKYSDKLPPWMFYTAFPQIMSRIVHSNDTVYQHLQNIIVKVVSYHPRQALWSLTAVCKSTSRDRSSRGARIISQIKESLGRGRKDNTELELKSLITQSQRVTDQLLHLCNADLPPKAVTVSLARDLGFNHAVAPCYLVIPLQTVLTVVLPPTPESLKSHVPFTSHQPTISGFNDEADIMSSLQKPRKIKMRGSDGKMYPFLCKPKDDLRKDARLMEFNNMINRFLKKDAESSRRRLYIRTYFVTPLNEECGLIEWVNNVRPLRDILLKSYKTKRVPIQYGEIRALLDVACSDPSKSCIFTEDIIPRFPPVFHEWFVEMFSEPAAWFASRIAYSRTSAVMSMVGHVLGLGDRHGENILFDETNGDTLHVDFNCLFDKGLSFEKPEKVPFRLTHNMVDALGVAGYEGIFRRTCETAMRVLRNNEDTLMTVLETFLHDPAVDMVKKKKPNSKVPDTPKAVLETIQNKLRGLFQGETVPLSVEGQVQELLRMAVSAENLCAMYIGWCAFL